MEGTFFTFTSENVSSMLGYIRELVADFMPLLIPIMSILLGLVIIWAIIGAIKGH